MLPGSGLLDANHRFSNSTEYNGKEKSESKKIKKCFGVNLEIAYSTCMLYHLYVNESFLLGV